jgi:hypothetical protein
VTYCGLWAGEVCCMWADATRSTGAMAFSVDQLFIFTPIESCIEGASAPACRIRMALS